MLLLVGAQADIRRDWKLCMGTHSRDSTDVGFRHTKHDSKGPD